MHFQQELFQTYQKIRGCALVRNRDTSDASLREFEDLLNSCQPNHEEKSVQYGMVKAFYNARKNQFIHYVRGTNLECTTLWTESKAIVACLNLRGVIYLSYDRTTGKYNVQIHHKPEGGVAPTAGPDRYHRSDLNGQEITVGPAPVPKPRPPVNVDLGLDQFPGLTGKSGATCAADDEITFA